MGKRQILEKFLNSILAVDTESTGLDPKVVEICEVGSAHFKDDKIVTSDILLGTNEPIPYMASSKNNISRSMLKGLPTFKDKQKEIGDILKFGDKSVKYFVAHNYKYDQTILEASYDRVFNTEAMQILANRRWICTYRLSKHLFKASAEDPDLNYQLNYLRYAFDLDTDGRGTHRAGDDSAVCLQLMQLIASVVLETIPEEELHDGFDLGKYLMDLAASPIIYTEMPFGKHKGVKLSEVPDEYFKWMLNKSDILDDKNDNYDPDFAASVEAELNNRVKD